MHFGRELRASFVSHFPKQAQLGAFPQKSYLGCVARLIPRNASFWKCRSCIARKRPFSRVRPQPAKHCELCRVCLLGKASIPYRQLGKSFEGGLTTCRFVGSDSLGAHPLGSSVLNTDVTIVLGRLRTTVQGSKGLGLDFSDLDPYGVSWFRNKESI